MAEQPASVRTDVVLVLGQVARGGTEIQMLELAAQLQARGLAVLLVVVEAERWLTVDGVPTVSLGVRRRGPRGLLSLLRASWELRRLIARVHPRVVHSALARAYVVTALAARRGGPVRYVTWRRNRGVHLESLGVAGRALERFSARRHDLVVANSTAVADYWSALFGPSVEIVVVPNALPQRFFDAPAVVHAPIGRGDVARIVSVGALKAVKNHALVVDALKIVSKNAVTPVELVLVGDGALRGELERRAREAGVRLTITGVVDDVLPELARSTVYVHAASSEGLSNAVLEAMASGCAVIVPEIPGMRDLVGDAALIYQAGSADGLAGQITVAVADPQLRSELGARARARVVDHQPERIIDRYLSLYGVSDSCAA